MKRGCAAILLAAAAAAGFADQWKFIVSGDGRCNDVTPDPSGINMPVARKLFDAMNKEGAKFMLWTGDLVHGVYGAVKTPIADQLDGWKQLASSLQGVTILPVRGNHETRGDADGSVWINRMKPWIDSAKPTYFAGEEGYSYSYTPPNDRKLTVIAIDQYINAHRVNLGELEKAMKAAKAHGAKNIFVFAHEMAFTCTAHGDDDNLSKYPEDRDKFLDLLQKYNVRYFFAGHDHVYDWMEIRNKKWPKSYVLNQIVDGTAGAPFYEDKGYFGDHGTFDLKRKEHRDKVYGYMVVTVDDRERVKVEFRMIDG